MHSKDQAMSTERMIRFSIEASLLQVTDGLMFTLGGERVMGQKGINRNENNTILIYENIAHKNYVGTWNIY